MSLESFLSDILFVTELKIFDIDRLFVLDLNLSVVERRVGDHATFDLMNLLVKPHGKRADDGGVEERERKGKPACTAESHFYCAVALPKIRGRD